MIFHLKIMLDIIFSGYNVSPTAFHSTLCKTYHPLCILVRQPITEVKAEWNVAADVWENGLCRSVYRSVGRFVYRRSPTTCETGNSRTLCLRSFTLRR